MCVVLSCTMPDNVFLGSCYLSPGRHENKEKTMSLTSVSALRQLSSSVFFLALVKTLLLVDKFCREWHSL